MRVCSVPGCPAIHDGTTSRCTTHETAAKQAHWSRTTAYNTRGHKQRFRPGVLARWPICSLCPNQATVADHYPLSRLELIDAGMDPNDAKHGRSLCASCHSRETANTPGQRGGWNNRD